MNKLLYCTWFDRTTKNTKFIIRFIVTDSNWNRIAPVTNRTPSFNCTLVTPVRYSHKFTRGWKLSPKPSQLQLYVILSMSRRAQPTVPNKTLDIIVSFIYCKIYYLKLLKVCPNRCATKHKLKFFRIINLHLSLFC